MTTAYAGTIVIKGAGQLIPEAYINILTDRRKSGVGVASASPEQMLLSVCGDALATADVMAAQEEGKEFPAVFYFASHPDKANVDDIQPYVLLKDDKDQPLVLGFVEGNFSEYADEKSERADGFHLAMTYLIPKISQFYNMVGHDIGRLEQELRSPIVSTEMKRLPSARGAIVLMLRNGACIDYNKDNMLGGTFPWGWTSDTLGYTENAGTTSDVNKDKPKLSLFKKPMTASVPASPPPAPIKKDDPPFEPDKKVGPEYQVPEHLPEGLTYNEKSGKFYAQCPDKVGPKKDREQWYRSWTGACPSNYKTKMPQAPKVELSHQMTQAMLIRVQKATEPKKDVEPKYVQVTNKEPEKSRPIVSAEDKAGIATWLKSGMVEKILDASSKQILSPEQMQELESKYPTFFEITGKHVEETFNWPWDIKVYLCKNHPEVAALLLLNTTTAYASLLAKEDKKEDVAETTPNTNTGPAQATVAAAPSGKSLFKRRAM